MAPVSPNLSATGKLQKGLEHAESWLIYYKSRLQQQQWQGRRPGNLKGGMELPGVNYQLELGCSCRSRCAGSRLGRWGFTKQKKNKTLDRTICHLHIARSIKKGELLIKTLSVKLTCQRFFFLTLLKCVDSLLNNYYTTTIAPTLFQSFLLHSLMGCRQFSDKEHKIK